MNNKVKSFTLSEMLVVMVITVIIVGIAFTVLNLVRKQINFIETNFSKTTELALCKQQLWQDFNQHSQIWFNAKEQTLMLTSELDTINYSFSKEYLLRQKDTIKTK